MPLVLLTLSHRLRTPAVEAPMGWGNGFAVVPWPAARWQLQDRALPSMMEGRTTQPQPQLTCRAW